jgi:hypothetical protein
VLLPGGTVRVSDVGVEAHFVQVRKVADGRSVADAEAAVQSQEQLDQIAPEMGAPSLIVTPGHTVEVTNSLLVAGDYLLLDWFPVEGDTSGAYHTDRGLIGHFTVSGAPPVVVTPTESYVIDPALAIAGPTDLTSGHHILALQFVGDPMSVFPTVIRVDAAHTADSAVQELADVFGADVWPVGSGEQLSHSTIASMYGPLGGTVLDIGLDLEPGTYVLAGLGYDPSGAPVLGASQITLTVAA